MGLGAEAAAPGAAGCGAAPGHFAACEVLIRDVLKPAHVPVIVPTEFNYLVDVTGAFARRLEGLRGRHASKKRLMERIEGIV